MKRFLLLAAVLLCLFALALTECRAAPGNLFGSVPIPQVAGTGTNTSFTGSAVTDGGRGNMTNWGTSFFLNFTPASAVSGLVWGGGSTVDGGEILFNQAHPNEIQITSKGSLSLNAAYGYAGVNAPASHIGSSGEYHDAWFMQYDRLSANINGGSVTGYSKPLGFSFYYWNGSSVAYDTPNFQGSWAAGNLPCLELYSGNAAVPYFSAGVWNKGSMWARFGANSEFAGALTALGFLTTSGEVRANSTRIGQNKNISVTWSSDATDANTGIDTGIARQSAGQLLITDGSTSATAPGALGFKVPVLVKTANYTVSVTNSGTFFNNSGAGGTQTNTLPAAAAGLAFSFTQVAAQNITVRAAGSDTIRNVGQVTGAGGGVFVNTVGAHIEVFCPVAGTWYITRTNTPWTSF